MFEKYLEQKEQLLAEQLNLSDEYVNLYSILFNPKIEQSFKVYFSAEVDWWIYEEQIARSSNQRFNIDDPKLNAFLKQLDELYKKNARFSSLTLPQVINSAVKTRLNILCRPRTAIKWFVYRWEQTKTYHEIVKRLNYLFDNKYLADGFIEHIQRKNLIKSPNDLIPISEFDKIINEIDNEKIHSLSPEEFVQLMSPLFSFFNAEAENKDTAKIPLEAVIIYFDDKNLFSLSTKLEQMFRSGELLLISKKYLLGFIYKSLYDADNLYGSDDDNITKVTKEIEQANSNYLNMALSLKENLSKSMPEISEEEYYSQEDEYNSPTELSAGFSLPNNFDLNSKLTDTFDNISAVETTEISLETEPIEIIDNTDMKDVIENFNSEEETEFETYDKIIEEEIVAGDIGEDAFANMVSDDEVATNEETPIGEDFNNGVDNSFDETAVDNLVQSAEEEIDLSMYGFDIDGDSIVQLSIIQEPIKDIAENNIVVEYSSATESSDEPIAEEEVLAEFSNSISSNKNKLVDLLSALQAEFND